MEAVWLFLMQPTTKQQMFFTLVIAKTYLWNILVWKFLSAFQFSVLTKTKLIHFLQWSHVFLGFCPGKPCLNGGVCTEINNGFICECSVQFYGQRCENGQAFKFCWDCDIFISKKGLSVVSLALFMFLSSVSACLNNASSQVWIPPNAWSGGKPHYHNSFDAVYYCMEMGDAQISPGGKVSSSNVLKWIAETYFVDSNRNLLRLTRYKNKYTFQLLVQPLFGSLRTGVSCRNFILVSYFIQQVHVLNTIFYFSLVGSCTFSPVKLSSTSPLSSLQYHLEEQMEPLWLFG